ncbi:hypothetical protein RJT34_32567 [Clitoria ternatea]|uniref:Uncharacterized protein n=1 Tax=Clitoria ternatea TaxID=43366 RepID=A0AAN9I2G0_CLITE
MNFVQDHLLPVMVTFCFFLYLACCIATDNNLILSGRFCGYTHEAYCMPCDFFVCLVGFVYEGHKDIFTAWLFAFANCC